MATTVGVEGGFRDGTVSSIGVDDPAIAELVDNVVEGGNTVGGRLVPSAVSTLVVARAVADELATSSCSGSEAEVGGGAGAGEAEAAGVG